MTRPFREFARLQSSGGIVLLAAAFAAIIWSNSPWSTSYGDLWHETAFSIGLGDFSLSMPIEMWINDLFMALFFLLVGLEIKREFLVGELNTTRKAILPVAAAAGGMVVPGLIYAAINLGRPTLHGWGVPVATDIAFALGVLALMGRRAPASLKIFLASLAIADDLGALVVIAFFYTEQLHTLSLAVAVALFAVLVLVNVLGFRHPFLYGTLGLLLWMFVLKSGVHATIAGVAVAITIPARPGVVGNVFLNRIRGAIDQFEQESGGGATVLTNPQVLAAVHTVDHAAREAKAPLQRIERALHPWVAFLIIPLFALANAGVHLSAATGNTLMSPVALGVFCGLVIGKPIGIFGASWLAVRFGFAALPAGVGWTAILGVAFLGGIGFTMSLFIGHLAFENQADMDAAKVSILAASVVCATLGAIALSQPTDRVAHDSG
ncbi:MAG TPA: Na+/H+ antiporter NhaA [Gammaproteobacteria bacterium]|nr:Na+/H+ antiporter NhaA [Gammaproteobacteria bacterium]